MPTTCEQNYKTANNRPRFATVKNLYNYTLLFILIGDIFNLFFGTMIGEPLLEDLNYNFSKSLSCNK